MVLKFQPLKYYTICTLQQHHGGQNNTILPTMRKYGLDARRIWTLEVWYGNLKKGFKKYNLMLKFPYFVIYIQRKYTF